MRLQRLSESRIQHAGITVGLVLTVFAILGGGRRLPMLLIAVKSLPFAAPDRRPVGGGRGPGARASWSVLAG